MVCWWSDSEWRGAVLQVEHDQEGSEFGPNQCGSIEFMMSLSSVVRKDRIFWIATGTAFGYGAFVNTQTGWMTGWTRHELQWNERKASWSVGATNAMRLVAQSTSVT